MDRPIRDTLRKRETLPRAQTVSARDKKIVVDGQDRSARDNRVRKQKTTRWTTTSHAVKPTGVKETDTSTRDSMCSQNARGAPKKISQSRFQDDFEREAEVTNKATVWSQSTIHVPLSEGGRQHNCSRSVVAAAVARDGCLACDALYCHCNTTCVDAV